MGRRVVPTSHTLRGGASLLLAALLTAACGSPNAGTKVAPTTAPAQRAQAQQAPQAPATAPAVSAPRPTAAPKAAAEPKFPTVYKVGDTIKVQDHTMTVLSAKRDGTKLAVEVQINNTGSKELAVSSLVSFGAKSTAGDTLGYAIALGGDSLDGKVLPNDKLKGTLNYTVPSDAEGFKLLYTPALFGEGAIVVALDEEATKTPFPKPAEATDPKPFAKGATFKEGEAVVNKDVVAKLTEAKVEGKVVTASFVVYNGGQKDVSISSLVSFDAKDGEGTKGKFKLVTQGPQLDGKLVPGDTVKGNLQWEFAAPPKDVKVYYTDGLFGGDTIVWSVQ